jgi:hypothetical protein
MQHKTPGIFSITEHETSTDDGFGVVSEVAKGYWTRGLTDGIQENQRIIEQFDYDIEFFRPTVG